MIRGSEVIIFRNEEDLETMFERLGEETKEPKVIEEAFDFEIFQSKIMSFPKWQKNLLLLRHRRDSSEICQL